MTSNESPSATLEIFKAEDEKVNDKGDEMLLEGTLSSSVDSSSNPSDRVSSPGFNTLDEPIKETILRDLRAVGKKFHQVLYPVEKEALLREWDLWGPMILCTMMATLLQGHDTTTTATSTVTAEDGKTVPKAASDPAVDDEGGPEFAVVFVVLWVGALGVTLNTKFLGGNISFFQSACVLGYCLLPLSASLLVCRILLFTVGNTTPVLVIRWISVILGFLWSTYASIQFLGDTQPDRKKILTTYPMFLFYLIIGWLVISHH